MSPMGEPLPPGTSEVAGEGDGGRWRWQRQGDIPVFPWSRLLQGGLPGLKKKAVKWLRGGKISY